MIEFLQSLFGEDLGKAGLIVLNLVLVESLLSVDNAAVLATMVMDLKPEERKRALKYGIIGAYVFRGICLVLAAWLVTIWWLKPLGGLYLLYIAANYFITKSTPKKEDDLLNKRGSRLYRVTLGRFGPFWATVILVEIMDLAFSIDNVFAAVAFTENIYLICIGVFIGILAMRFVAQFFVSLMERYPFLETMAFAVIAVLGLKLAISVYTHFYPETGFSHFMDSEAADLGLSILTVTMFGLPLLTSMLFNFPKRREAEKEVPAEV